MFSFESPHRRDFNEYIQYSIFKMNTKVTLNYFNLQLWNFSQGTIDRVRNNRGKRAISVRATEGLLYIKVIVLAILQFLL